MLPIAVAIELGISATFIIYRRLTRALFTRMIFISCEITWRDAPNYKVRTSAY